ncbi:hypothetical protein GCK72_015528 [Caenorhabditis remanei]|uniref:Uncharacterized protein n=1 Tax=Caenorhabditis remanei TaxID=31234 RepID=A0A6A5GUB5_CAERE|nr:hypothetical protein GCK72_015528 [Caenorhabditis remanei]KAF1759068.1 hypothetical protein GCK72_015528 [Caenorhabditis remanei]
MLSLGQRRSSDGYLNANDLLSQGGESLLDSAGLGTSQPNLKTQRRGTNPSIFDGHFMMDALRRNYEIG